MKALSSHEQVELFNIAHLMNKAGLPDDFISAAIFTALKYEGVADLMRLWRDEAIETEKDEIIADMQEIIDDCAQPHVENYTLIKLNNLDAVAKDIRAFKDSLLNVVNKLGGITHLSELTHIPQPSLSRFFNSNSMPRRSTLLKIGAALELDAIQISLDKS